MAKEKNNKFIETAVLKIELRAAPYPLWRRIQVDTGVTLEQLHMIIQILFLWEDAHLHHFIINEERYIPEEDDDGDLGLGIKDYTENVRLKDILKLAKQFMYEYDFGDSWIHDITFEKIVLEEKHFAPKCLGAAGEDPLEDIGGVGGFADFLETVKQKKLSKETKELLDWHGLTVEEARQLPDMEVDTDFLNSELNDFWDGLQKK